MRLNHTVVAAAVALSAATGVAVAGVEGDPPADDPDRLTGTVDVRAVPAREGDGTARIVVTRAPGAPARFRWGTQDGTATAGEDFDAAGGLVQFRPGERSKTLTVDVADDGRDEGTETVDVRLDVAPGLTGSAAPAITTLTIRD